MDRQTTPAPGLAREAIGLREVLFQSITHMAPAAAVAFSIIVGAPFGSGALPLAVVLALVACLLVAVSIGQLAKHLPSAGGFYTYVSRGLHPSLGFLVAFGYALAEALVAPLLYLIFGNVVATTFHTEFGWSYDLWWMIAAVAAALFVFALGYLGIRISAGTGTILGVFEIAVFAVLAVWLIAKAGGNNTLSVFSTSHANVKDFEGFSGVAAASIFTILAFIGFEAAAPMAEEARDPRRTIGRAVVWSALAIGIFYVLTTYAATVYFGPDKMAGFISFGGGNPWDGLARAVWGAGWVAVFLAIANSAIANSNAGATATTRMWYAMARIRLLPAAFARIHPTRRSPYVAVSVQLVVALVVALWLGNQFTPLEAFRVLPARAPQRIQPAAAPGGPGRRHSRIHSRVLHRPWNWQRRLQLRQPLALPAQPRRARRRDLVRPRDRLSHLAHRQASRAHSRDRPRLPRRAERASYIPGGRPLSAAGLERTSASSVGWRATVCLLRQPRLPPRT